jgi:hypothetical protein
LNLPQYLSSDIIRCLKISHDIHVKDVLDEFPVYRKASAAIGTTIGRARHVLIALECKYVLDPEVASTFRRCAANLTRALIDMERLERLAVDSTKDESGLTRPTKEGQSCPYCTKGKIRSGKGPQSGKPVWECPNCASTWSK